jgi:hypothetical protein
MPGDRSQDQIGFYPKSGMLLIVGALIACANNHDSHSSDRVLFYLNFNHTLNL